MAVRRPQRQVREFTTGEGHQLGEMPNISTRFANEFPPECALDLVKSRLDFHGRPAATSGADRRLAVFSRALWLGRLATALFGLTLIVTICGMQAMCMFRDYCFRNKPATSPIALAMAFPVAAVVVFILVPLGLASLKLRLRWLLGAASVLLVAACVAMFVGSIWLLATTEPEALATTVSTSWDRLTILERRAYRGGPSENWHVAAFACNVHIGQHTPELPLVLGMTLKFELVVRAGELQSIVEGDAKVAGVFGLVSTVLLACGTLASILLWLQWAPGAAETGLWRARYLGPLTRQDRSPATDPHAPEPAGASPRARGSDAPASRGGEVDESDDSEDGDAKPSGRPNQAAASLPAARRPSGQQQGGGGDDGKAQQGGDAADSADSADTGDTGDDGTAPDAGEAAQPRAAGDGTDDTDEKGSADGLAAGPPPGAAPAPREVPDGSRPGGIGGADAKGRRR